MKGEVASSVDSFSPTCYWQFLVLEAYLIPENIQTHRIFVCHVPTLHIDVQFEQQSIGRLAHSCRKYSPRITRSVVAREGGSSQQLACDIMWAEVLPLD